MVSNSFIKNINRTYFIRPIFIIGVLVSLSFNSFAEDIKDYYSATIQKNGTLYFIEPEYEFKNKDDKSEFTFDLTHISSSDSIVINFTYIYTDLLALNELTFDNGQKKISSPVDQIFTEARKKVWHHRYSATFLLADVEDIFKAGNKAAVVISAKDAEQSVYIKDSKWVKHTEILSTIIKVINANK